MSQFRFFKQIQKKSLRGQAGRTDEAYPGEVHTRQSDADEQVLQLLEQTISLFNFLIIFGKVFKTLIGEKC